jgi:hypothetical protein
LGHWVCTELTPSSYLRGAACGVATKTSVGCAFLPSPVWVDGVSALPAAVCGLHRCPRHSPRMLISLHELCTWNLLDICPLRVCSQLL